MNVSHGFTHGRNECATGRPPASAVRFSTGVLSRVVATPRGRRACLAD
jgi:hypothetical protein